MSSARRASPVNLPPLSTLTSAQPPREGNAAWVSVGLVALAAGIFWWAQANTDLVERAAAALASTSTALQNQVSGEVRTGAAAISPPQEDQRVVPPAAQPAAPPVPPRTASSAASTVPVTGMLPHVVTAHPATAHREAVPPATQRVAPPLARIELAADALEVLPLQPVASVVVQRRHNYRNGVSFSWWTESGTAKPGQDYVPVKARTDYIAAGENETHLLVPIVADPRRHLSKSFYVVVGDPSDDAALGSRTITMITIPAVN